jgi:hypothetical protein
MRYLTVFGGGKTKPIKANFTGRTMNQKIDLGF